MAQPRTHAGVPSGGEFAPSAHDETDRGLSVPEWPDSNHFIPDVDHLDDWLVYSYRGDMYTPKGIVDRMIRNGDAAPAAVDMETEDVLNQVAGANGIDREDESSFEGGEFPKTEMAECLAVGDTVIDVGGKRKVVASEYDCGDGACGRDSCATCNQGDGGWRSRQDDADDEFDGDDRLPERAEFANGTVLYKLDDKLHRDDGPAVIRSDGSKEWWKHGKIHRLDGPARIGPSGIEEWFKDGERHRLDGPALTYPGGSQYWYQGGNLHRDGGPAVIRGDGTEEWWTGGLRSYTLPGDEY